ncbi:chromosome segregation protein SMC [Shewanella psychrotolerans]|uniref:chromosome segregation protein SMC n=1 Tax=Shewanella psychrotolerans TaxID=2864206 RepID=UPI001C65A700|nr:chromosome segregation protein SMC [Shewanella psychrotolerans]QYK02726.1 chromosome segregation protein SMC [Shewanella psychrotolerans]
MRLKQIKLAGFKSFVDVTKIPFNQPLTAIIGPNGCGKSNVIDAVRWVLGESSAKNLRGDSMTDVIFNGSSARRPVSVASVELSFDNQEGRLAGQYASYQEIAVKRQVSRDGDSSYFLNGQKCRRKDITDLFMGTGLGPRSYAIIEQGTISRLIESKPQELRVFIEEAAGISRYKERRRETENRIRHTRENLERLGDIRQELGRQIDKLAEQAQAAKQYRELKQTERRQDAELNVSRLLELQAQLEKLTAEITAQELKKSELDAGNQSLQGQATELKLKLEELDQDEHSQVEAFYINATQIAKLEQSLKHRQQQDEHLKKQLATTQQKLALTQAQWQALDVASTTLDERYQSAVAQQQDAQQRIALIDEQMSEAQLSLEQHSESFTRVKQEQHQHQLQFQGAQSEYKHLTSNLAQKLQQKSALQSQLSKLSSVDGETTLQLQQSQCDSLIAQCEQLTFSNQQKTQQLTALEQQDKRLQQQIDALSQSLAEERGRFNIVERLLPHVEETGSRALWQSLDVEPGWEVAVDLALDGVLTQKVDVDESQVGFSQYAPKQWQGVRASVNLAPWLEHLRWATDLAGAKAMLATLAPFERIVTADGYLLGQGFLLQKSEQSSALVQLQMEKEALIASIANSEDSLHQLREQSLVVAQQLLDCRALNQQGATLLQGVQLELERISTQVDATKERISHAQEQQRHYSDQLEALAESELIDEQRLQVIGERLAKDELQANELQKQAEMASVNHTESRALTQRLKLQRDDLVVELNKHQTLLQSLNTEIALNQQQSGQYQQQIQELTTSLEALGLELDGSHQAEDDSSSQMQQQLSAALDIQQQKQQSLDKLRAQQAELQTQLDQIVSKQKQQLAKIEHLIQAISALSLRREGIKGQADSQHALLVEHDIDVQTVKCELDSSLSLGSRQKALERTRSRIEHLGAINLAAIEEYEQQSERKHYLDSQDADLTKALNSLEEAIRKIDKETKTRFKETFDKVNQDLGVLFPKVFGGGSAHLALTDDDLLDTGVTIMARPPGKKNSTIHLLSGGEKALTALSLVFAIFRLNPAPFCMLDEVDAPLDDANVDRFCRLVKEMSQSVQFVYISHNKITMELADQLIGVTMHEPGVSRIVAVDIDEAVALADAG